MTTIELDPYQVHLVGRALAEGHRVTACEQCGGPEVHSQIRPEAKCFRCLAFRITGVIAAELPLRKCKRCKKGFRSRMNWVNCENCQQKLKKQARRNTNVEDANRASI